MMLLLIKEQIKQFKVILKDYKKPKGMLVLSVVATYEAHPSPRITYLKYNQPPAQVVYIGL